MTDEEFEAELKRRTSNDNGRRHTLDDMLKSMGITRDELEDDCPNCGTLQAALDEEIGRRCLGGTPPPVDAEWANQKLPPPDSATTGPTTLKGMRSSRDWGRNGGAATQFPPPEPGEKREEIPALKRPDQREETP